jgi:hypothetical protein
MSRNDYIIITLQTAGAVISVAIFDRYVYLMWIATKRAINFAATQGKDDGICM